MEYTLNCNGRLIDLSTPQVMGILNVTPDSFYAGSRKQTEQEIVNRVEEILTQGGSVDTFRPAVARIVVEEFGADIINDVGAPANSSLFTLHSSLPMFRMVSRLRVPYIYMSRQATMHDILLDCAKTVDHLRSLGQKDIVLDPGYGFGKTLEQNYAVMAEQERMKALQLPILVGISRKSMIYRLLDIQQDEALNGTTALNTIALLKGADILRVHDVREAVECLKIVAATKL